MYWLRKDGSCKRLVKLKSRWTKRTFESTCLCEKDRESFCRLLLLWQMEKKKIVVQHSLPTPHLQRWQSFNQSHDFETQPHKFVSKSASEDSCGCWICLLHCIWSVGMNSNPFHDKFNHRKKKGFGNVKKKEDYYHFIQRKEDYFWVHEFHEITSSLGVVCS